MATASTEGAIDVEYASCHEEFINISLRSKEIAKPYTRTQVEAGASSRIPELFHFSYHPRLHLQDLVAGCRLSRLPLIAYSTSYGPSLEPATVSLFPSYFLDLFSVTCCSPPQPVQESESWHSATKSWLFCKNII